MHSQHTPCRALPRRSIPTFKQVEERFIHPALVRQGARPSTRPSAGSARSSDAGSPGPFTPRSTDPLDASRHGRVRHYPSLGPLPDTVVLGPPPQLRPIAEGPSHAEDGPARAPSHTHSHGNSHTHSHAHSHGHSRTASAQSDVAVGHQLGAM